MGEIPNRAVKGDDSRAKLHMKTMAMLIKHQIYQMKLCYNTKNNLFSAGLRRSACGSAEIALTFVGVTWCQVLVKI